MHTIHLNTQTYSNAGQILACTPTPTPLAAAAWTPMCFAVIAQETQTVRLDVPAKEETTHGRNTKSTCIFYLPPRSGWES